jgi:phosphoribosylamine-glycine ligase
MPAETQPIMTITMGDLVSTLFDVYDQELHDQHLAAVATQVRIVELLSRRSRPQRRRALSR